MAPYRPYPHPYALDEADSEQITTFERVLEALTTYADEGANVDELEQLVRMMSCGSQVVTPAFEPNMEIFRAVRYREKPPYKSQISYPPAQFASRGRLNCAGEPIFYGSVGVPANVFLECRAEVGQTFALGRWRTTKKLMFHHLGYTGIRQFGEKIGKLVQPWMNSDEDSTRNAILHRWQSKILTRHVKSDEEHLYELSIAMGRVAMHDIAMQREGDDHPQEFAGVLYPSVATRLRGDNVAIKTSVVESSLQLAAVYWLRVQDIVTPDWPEPERITLEMIDQSTMHRSDGRLIWNGEPTFLSVSPWP